MSIQYINDRPIRVDSVVVSSQHSPEVTYENLKEGIIEEVVRKVIPAELLDEKTKYFINPTGRFVIGGPMGDFSGKDPSKVDRSASYMGRYVAKNIVAAGLADKCEVQLAYAIGVAEPVSVMINTFGTGKIPSNEIARIAQEEFDMRPAAIIKTLDLLRPIYKQTAAYGHFGRALPEFTWEKIDRADSLRKRAGL